jgi:hypothetical protein
VIDVNFTPDTLIHRFYGKNAVGADTYAIYRKNYRRTIGTHLRLPTIIVLTSPSPYRFFFKFQPSKSNSNLKRPFYGNK